MLLESKRIRLRPLKMDDLLALNHWRNDAKLRYFALMHPYPITLEIDKEWFTHILHDTSNKQIVFGVEYVENQLLIGYFQLKDIDLLHKHAFLGIIIGDPQYQGKGLGKEILDLGVNYAFNILGLQKISLEVVEENQRAFQLYKKLGFKKEGQFNNHFYFNGKYHTVIRMAIHITEKPKIDST